MVTYGAIHPRPESFAPRASRPVSWQESASSSLHQWKWILVIFSVGLAAAATGPGAVNMLGLSGVCIFFALVCMWLHDMMSGGNRTFLALGIDNTLIDRLIGVRWIIFCVLLLALTLNLALSNSGMHALHHAYDDNFQWTSAVYNACVAFACLASCAASLKMRGRRPLLGITWAIEYLPTAALGIGALVYYMYTFFVTYVVTFMGKNTGAVCMNGETVTLQCSAKRQVQFECGELYSNYNVTTRECTTNASFAASNTALLSNAFEIVLVLYLLTATMVFGDYAYLHRRVSSSSSTPPEAAAHSSSMIWYTVLFQLFTTVTFPLLYPQNYRFLADTMQLSARIWMLSLFRPLLTCLQWRFLALLHKVWFLTSESGRRMWPKNRRSHELEFTFDRGIVLRESTAHGGGGAGDDGPVWGAWGSPGRRGKGAGVDSLGADRSSVGSVGYKDLATRRAESLRALSARGVEEEVGEGQEGEPHALDVVPALIIVSAMISFELCQRSTELLEAEGNDMIVCLIMCCFVVTGLAAHVYSYSRAEEKAPFWYLYTLLGYPTQDDYCLEHEPGKWVTQAYFFIASLLGIVYHALVTWEAVKSGDSSRGAVHGLIALFVMVQAVVIETRRRRADRNVVIAIIALNLGMVFYGFMAEMDETEHWWKKYVRAASAKDADGTIASLSLFNLKTLFAVVHHSIFFATVEHHFGVAEELLLELMH